MFVEQCANLTSALHEPGTTPIPIRRHPATRTHSRAGAITARTRLLAAVAQQDWKRTKCAATTVSVSLFSSAIARRHPVPLAIMPTLLVPRRRGRSQSRRNRFIERIKSRHQGLPGNASHNQEHRPSRRRNRVKASHSHDKASHSQNKVSLSHGKASRAADPVIPIARANRRAVRSHGNRIHAVRSHGTRNHAVQIRVARNAIGRTGLFAVR